MIYDMNRINFIWFAVQLICISLCHYLQFYPQRSIGTWPVRGYVNRGLSSNSGLRPKCFWDKLLFNPSYAHSTA